MDVSRGASPRVADDFTCIDGIGPVTQKRLHSAGLRTFAQLAALSAEGIASLIPNLSKKQITNQHWIEQASSKAGAKARETEPVISASRQHYENFTLEFLLTEKNKIRRLQIVHIQSGDVDTLTKWDAERLMDFLARHAGVRLPYSKAVSLAAPKPTSRPSKAAEQHSEIIAGTASIPPGGKSEEKIDLTPSRGIAEPTSPISLRDPAEEVPQPLPSPAVSASPINKIGLLEWKTFLISTQQPVHNLPHDQCFGVNLTLDLAHASLPDGGLLDFNVSLYAKKLGDGTRRLIGETQKTVPSAKVVDLTVGNASLPQGLYRLEAHLTLVPADASLSTGSDINASFPGGLLQVY
jgi:hypothetical protein